MLELNTNYYIETYHNVPNSRYLGSYQKQRTDILLHLLHKFLPDYRVNFVRVLIGLLKKKKKRQTDLAMTQLKKCIKLSSEKLFSLVRHRVVGVGEADYSGVILVKSFTFDGQEYLFSLNQTSAIGCCSYITDSKLV